MSYVSVEQSIAGGQPVELYQLKQGVNYFCYTGADQAVTLASLVYQPISIERNSIKVNEDTFKSGITLTVHRTEKFASDLLLYSPDEPITLTILRGHFSDGDYQAYWKGRVSGVEASGNKLNIECESIFTSMKNPGLRAHFEYTCRHALYSGRCGALTSNYDAPLTITNVVSPVTFDLVGAAALGAGWFTGGMLRFANTYRFITSHVGDRITITRPLAGLELGSDVILFPGCDHSKESCKNKFNNIENFGGFPWVPLTNPMTGSSIV